MVKRARDVLNRPFAPRFLKLVFQGVFIGLVTGIVVSLFRWLIDHTLQFLFVLYPYLAKHPLYIIFYALLLVGICWLLGKILKYDLTNLVGSGVPQIEAVLTGENKMNCWQILWRKFVGGLLAICPGLLLGREGPCIQMGACIGQGFARDAFKTSEDDQKILMAAGIAAGLSAAFSAPLAGVLFLLEEVTTSFKTKIWITALAAALVSDFVTLVTLGAKPSMYLKITPSFTQANLFVFIALGCVIGILAFGYQYTILDLKFFYSKLKAIPKVYHSIVPLLLTIPLGLWNAKLLGGSHDFISYVIDLSLGSKDWLQLLKLLVLFFVIRFVFSMISYGASVPGGIFMPILSLGAIIGCIAGISLLQFGVIEQSQYLGVVLISMAAYFGAIEKAPFTAIVLLTEMAGSLAQVFPLVLVTFVAYVVNEWLGGRPIYTALREEMTFEN